MAQVEFYAPVESIHGKLDKTARVIMRKKQYRAPNGAVLAEGVQESYIIVHPRDFDRTPAQGAELANMKSFGELSLMVTEIIRSERYTEDELAAMTSEQRAHVYELKTQLENFRARFYAQFKQPDPEAPLEKKPQPGASVRRRRQYVKLDTFIQAILRERRNRTMQQTEQSA